MENPSFKPPSLPDKLYFKVGEVSEITGLPAHVLRFWETEFKKINPKRTDSGQRLYRKSDVELILVIKYLLYEKKFTIPGARQFLKTASSETSPKDSGASILELLDELRQELKAIRKIIE
jgi:DNA-binding transcriptional MerR regulator